MYLWYKFLTYLFYPFASFFLFFRKLKKKEHPIRYKEKLSKIDIQRNEGFLIWFHVASVGEAMSILPLIESFEQDPKIRRILITSITLSSAEVLKKRFDKNIKIIHQFLPFDVPQLVEKFIKHWSPNLSIFVDSEIWPNLIFEIKKRNVPLLMINGRISKKTFLRWKFIGSFSKKIFEKFDLCLVANNETENYLKILGAKNIKNYGNLKFARTKLNSNKNLDSDFLDKIKERKIWCAASTHPSEEIFCAKTHLLLKKKFSNILTIIIPRHINRINKISEELSNLNLKINLYSKFRQMDIDTDILLVDSYGEASKFYNISKCVLLGKSLTKSSTNTGGQNPIEASRLGCKIFYGSGVENFAEIYKYLKTLGVAEQINSPEELQQVLINEFNENKVNNSEVLKKIENFGLNILSDVVKEIKIYINT